MKALLPWAVLGFASTLFAEETPLPSRAMIFPETVSSGGEWALGWGLGGPKAAEFDLSKPDGLDSDKLLDAMDDGVVPIDVLVNAKTKKPIAVLSGEHWEIPNGAHRNHSSLDWSWSPDTRAGVVFFEAKWDTSAADWIIPSSGKVLPVLEPIEHLYRALLTKTKGREYQQHAVSYVTYYADSVLLDDHTLVVEATATVPKEDNGTYTHLLKFKVTPGSGSKANVELQQSIDTSKDQGSDHGGADKALNKYYQKLRAALAPAGREALKQEELTWIAQRDKLPEDERESFTYKRMVILRARAFFGGH
jgi:hypothetical protein